MTLAIPENEIREFLLCVEEGRISLQPTEEPQSVYAGPVEYKASNGWHITVFNDANEWDYIEWIVTPDGRRVDYDDLHETALGKYAPSDEVAWSRYRIPGYMKFRCGKCGSTFKYLKDKVYLCPACRQGGKT